jgi:hypothetical protein
MKQALILLLPLALTTVPVHPAAAQSADPALQLADVIALARFSGSDDAKADLIRSSCVTFPVDDAAVSRLQAGGVGGVILAAVRGACFAGAELTIQSQPEGAEVLVDNQRVGTTPWTGRFETARAAQVTVRSEGRTLNVPAPLQLRQRVRVDFAFAEDTIPVPGVRSVGEVARTLNLEQRWRPVTPEPRRPAAPATYNGGLLSIMMGLGGAVYGASYCAGMENHCWIEPMIEEDGADSMEPLRYLAGGAVGLVVGGTVHGMIQRVVNTTRRTSYRSALNRRESWEQSDERARAEWIRNHPDVADARTDDANARQRAEAHNIEVRARNQSIVPSRVTSEPIGEGS